MKQKHLLIVTGPQGSGNHFFSRVLSQHPDVEGWEDLKKEYWVPSDQEPFAEYWVNPNRLTADHFESAEFHLANVSCPFFFDGVRHVPKILEVAERAKSFGVEVEIAIVVRDQNINQLQQLRVRKEHTTPIAQEYYYNTLMPSNFPVHFISNEALFLHKEHYLKYLERTLQFPIDVKNPDVFKFLSADPNAKYVKHVDEYWLDQEVWSGIRSKEARGLK